MTWALREKVVAGFGLALLMLVVISIASYQSTRRSIETGRAVAHTREVLEKLTSLLTQMNSAESGVLGYIITGEERSLEPFRAAGALIDEELRVLRRLTADDARQQARLDILEPLMEARLVLLTEMVALRSSAGFEAARQLVLMDKDRGFMGAIRRLVGEGIREEEELLQRRHEEAARTARHAMLIIGVANCLAFVLVAIATWIISRDIAARKQAEAALRKSEELYHTLAKNFPNGAVLLFDHDLRYTIADGAGLATIGLSKEALEGKTIGEIFPPDLCALLEPRYRAALEGATSCIEVPFANRVYLVDILPVKNEQGTIFAGMVMAQDITQRKEVERLKDEFIATVSHELRTPLTSLRGFAELMLEREFPLDKRRRFLSIIHGETVRLTNLINDFLDLQRMEAGRQVYRRKRVDLLSALRESLAVFQVEGALHTLRVDAPESLPAVDADHDRLRQVLSNLLSNAIKFSPDGGTVTIGARLEATQVVVWVADQGVGIPPEALSRLFSKFFRVDAGQMRHIGGTGLGLALVKEIVEAHQGRVWVESEPNRGSTFYFTLPLWVEKAPPVVAPEVMAGNATDILLVENDLIFSQLLRERFENAGLSVTTTGYAERALELARLLSPRLLLVDIHLDGATDGWDLVVALKSDAVLQAIPIILITTSEEANLHGLALAGADYLPRPFAAAALLQAIRRHLPSLSGKHLLVADDDAAFRRQVVELLAAVDDLQVIEAANGHEVLACVAQRMPDLLLLDLLMPELDGFEVLHRLRADKRAMNLPVLVVTGKDLIPDEKTQLKRKMAALVSKKEASLDHFAQTVGRILGR
jgi:PAS domain S-box-containing protein